jgi:hypothetical protein
LTPTPRKEQKSAEVFEKKDGPKWEVQKSEKAVASDQWREKAGVDKVWGAEWVFRFQG